MPEFILDHGSPEASKRFRALDAFTQGYIEAMFFTEEERLCEEDGRNMPDVAINTATMESRFVGGECFTFAELAPATLQRIIKDCLQFQESEADNLSRAYGTQGKYEKEPYDAEKAGRDYWYSRNDHGTGFWDRGLGTIGESLSNAASGQVDVYVGDDGLIYLT